MSAKRCKCVICETKEEFGLNDDAYDVILMAVRCALNKWLHGNETVIRLMEADGDQTNILVSLKDGSGKFLFFCHDSSNGAQGLKVDESLLDAIATNP